MSYQSKYSIFVSNPKVFLHLNLPHPLGISNDAHQPLSNILDFIVIMQEPNMALHRGIGIRSRIDSCQRCDVLKTVSALLGMALRTGNDLLELGGH